MPCRNQDLDAKKDCNSSGATGSVVIRSAAASGFKAIVQEGVERSLEEAAKLRLHQNCSPCLYLPSCSKSCELELVRTGITQAGKPSGDVLPFEQFHNQNTRMFGTNMYQDVGRMLVNLSDPSMP